MKNKISTKYLSAFYRYMNAFSKQQHPAVATEFDPLIEALERIGNKFENIKDPVFLDLGCAAGNVLFTAKEVLGTDWNMTGIEIDQKLAIIAQGIDLSFNIVIMDLLSEESIELISLADVIFAYRPIPSFSKQAKLNEIIQLNMKKGAYYLANDGSPHKFNLLEILGKIEGVDCCSKTEITIYHKK